MANLLKIHFEENSGAHDDLTVELGQNWFKKTFDSYYFELDSIYETHFEGSQKTKLVLISLLEYWKNNIQELADNETCFLPIDFSDQYTGCFRITKASADLVIVYGSSLREGWSVYPSNPGDYAKTITDFKEDHSLPKIALNQQEFIDVIENNVVELQKINNKSLDVNEIPPVIIKVIKKGLAPRKRGLLNFIRSFFVKTSEEDGKKRRFNVPMVEVLALVNEAWEKRKEPLSNDPGIYVIPMGRIVGTQGETEIKIIVEPGTSIIKTAYPIK